MQLIDCHRWTNLPVDRNVLIAAHRQEIYSTDIPPADSRTAGLTSLHYKSSSLPLLRPL